MERKAMHRRFPSRKNRHLRQKNPRHLRRRNLQPLRRQSRMRMSNASTEQSPLFGRSASAHWARLYQSTQTMFSKTAPIRTSMAIKNLAAHARKRRLRLCSNAITAKRRHLLSLLGPRSFLGLGKPASLVSSHMKKFHALLPISSSSTLSTHRMHRRLSAEALNLRSRRSWGR